VTRPRRQGGSWFGWALGVLAALTLALSAPQHVLDLDEAAGPVAEASVHGHARTVMDHSQPGHSCAAHCAAHVMGDAPALIALKPPSPRPLAWALADDQDSRSGPAFQLERPPKA
jgi:hypothetical protein